jgi:outer membrane immunogenic protein
MKGWLFAGFALGVLMPPAMAADMPVKAPAYAPILSWTGIYLGADAGVRASRADMIETSITGDAVIFGGAPLAINPLVPTSFPLDGVAARGGGYLGINYQIGTRIVVGAEGDFGWGSQTTTLTGMITPQNMTANVGDSISVKTGWDASARGRIGVLLIPSFLLYATGGGAWLHVEANSTCGIATCPGGTPFDLPTPFSVTNATTRTGWTVGGGGEVMLSPNWLMRGEYRYADFGTAAGLETVEKQSVGVSGVPSRVFSEHLSVKIQTHTALVGIAYKLGD